MLLELARQAYNALKYNRRRSILTMLAWPGASPRSCCCSPTVPASSADSGRFPLLGHEPGLRLPRTHLAPAGGTKAGSEIKLTVNDLDYLQSEVPLLKRISPEAFKQSTVAYGTRSGSYGISGVYPYYQHMRRIDVEEGTFFTELDETPTAASPSSAPTSRRSCFPAKPRSVKSPRRWNFLRSHRRPQTRHPEWRRQHERQGLHPFSAMSDLTNTYYLNAIAMEYEGDHEKVAEAVRRSMAFHHEFDPKDKRAIFVFDVFADLLDLRVITTGIKILLALSACSPSASAASA